MNKIGKTLAGIVIAAGAAGVGCLFIPSEAKNIEVTSRPAIELNLNERKNEIRSAAISYLETFISDYVRDFSKCSDEMKNNIECFGGGDKGRKEVEKGYVKLYGTCLDTALAKSGELNQGEIDELADRLVKIEIDMTKKTDLSLTHPAIREAYKHWGKQKVNHFSRIIRANLNSKEKDYISMTRKAYTREEFIVMLNEQNEAEKVLFEGFKKSLENRPIHIRLIGPGLIDSQQKDSWKLNYRELEGFYGK